MCVTVVQVKQQPKENFTPLSLNTDEPQYIKTSEVNHIDYIVTMAPIK